MKKGQTLTIPQVLTVKLLLALGYTGREIQGVTDVSHASIHKIRTGKAYANIDPIAALDNGRR